MQPVAASGSCAWPIATPGRAVRGISCITWRPPYAVILPRRGYPALADVGGGVLPRDAQHIAELAVELVFGLAEIAVVQAGGAAALAGAELPPVVQRFDEPGQCAAVAAVQHGAVGGLAGLFVGDAQLGHVGQVVDDGFGLLAGERVAHDDGVTVHRRIDDKLRVVIRAQRVILRAGRADAQVQRPDRLDAADALRAVDDDIPLFIHFSHFLCSALFCFVWLYCVLFYNFIIARFSQSGKPPGRRPAIFVKTGRCGATIFVQLVIFSVSYALRAAALASGAQNV